MPERPLMNDSSPPHPRLKRDWIGRYVRLRRTVETQGGVIFPPGTAMKVCGYYHGLSLETVVQCRTCNMGRRYRLAKIAIAAVDLLPEDYTPPKEDV